MHGCPSESICPPPLLLADEQFINPILEWDEHDPENRTKWLTQQWHMTDMEPYVPFLLYEERSSRIDHTCIMSMHMIQTNWSGLSRLPSPSRSSRTYQKTCGSIMSGGSCLELSRAIGGVKPS
jgi:hypothetical protein